mgnify:CR=1 FL=1
MFEAEILNSPLLESGGLIGLFVFTLVSASLIPFGLPEAAVIGFWALGFEPISTMIVAAIGGTLGAVTSYYLGVAGNTYVLHKYIKPDKIKKAEKLFKNHGPIVLLLSWVPFIGDPLTAVAGLLKYPFKYFIIFVGTGKLVRFIGLYIIYTWF